MENEIFNLEYQYQLYLKRVGLEENRMSNIQSQQTKQAFMGACGQMLILLRDDVSRLDEETGVKTLRNIYDQINKYFKKLVEG